MTTPLRPRTPTGYWETDADLNEQEMAAVRPFLEQAAASGKQLVVYDKITLRWHPAEAAPDLRAALERIASWGCEASEEEPRVWDRCLDYNYREERPTGDPFIDRCNPCLAHAALAAPAADGLDVERLRRFEEHTGGLHCSEYHPEGTCEWQERCDEPGCKVEATCGFPVDGGYRRTCGDHMLAALHEPSREPGEEG